MGTWNEFYVGRTDDIAMATVRRQFAAVELEMSRSLVYGAYGPEERTWERVEGTPEPWEASVFFDPEELEYAIEDAQGDEAAQEELRRVWREKELVVGRALPRVDTKDYPRRIGAYLGLPHYG
jgi:hypothetical protein